MEIQQAKSISPVNTTRGPPKSSLTPRDKSNITRKSVSFAADASSLMSSNDLLDTEPRDHPDVAKITDRATRSATKHYSLSNNLYTINQLVNRSEESFKKVSGKIHICFNPFEVIKTTPD